MCWGRNDVFNLAEKIHRVAGLASKICKMLHWIRKKLKMYGQVELLG
jgi:hypothetical protein